MRYCSLSRIGSSHANTGPSIFSVTASSWASDCRPSGGLPVLRALPAEEQRAREILARHVDKDWSLCDAISFAVLDARHISAAFTFDRHFRQYGRIHVLGLKS